MKDNKRKYNQEHTQKHTQELKISISYVNDIHLDMWVSPEIKSKSMKEYRRLIKGIVETIIKNSKPLGELLIISGDLGKDVEGNIILLEFFSKYFNKIVITYGNHDLFLNTEELLGEYKDSTNKIKMMYKEIKERLGSKVHFLGEDFDNILEYKGFKIGGEIMISLPITEDEEVFYNKKNDIKYIKHNRKLLHEKNKKYYETLKGKKLDIFVSHYPIILTDSHRNYMKNIKSKASLGTYLTKMTYFIAPTNFYGHVHERATYKEKIANKEDYSIFLTHAIGYEWEDFNLSLNYIEVNK